jgi:hypothetical protein
VSSDLCKRGEIRPRSYVMQVACAVCRLTGDLGIDTVLIQYSNAKHILELRYFIMPARSACSFKFVFVLPHSLISSIYSLRSLSYDRCISSSKACSLEGAI